MNQILALPNDYQEINTKVTRKKNKRKRLVILPLILSTILCISSYKIYAFVSNLQDDRNNYEQVEKTNTIDYKAEQNNIEIINNGTNNEIENKNIPNNNVVKDEEKETNKINDNKNTNSDVNKKKNTNVKNNKYKASNGKTYTTIAILNIPSLGIEYPVLSSTSDELLKISLNKYWGANPNEVGNMCIVGHNYEDSRFFGKLNKIKKDAIVKITDLSGRTLEYKVYDTYVVGPYDTECTSQLTNGETEITLITCHSNGSKRLVVKARA